MEKCPLTRLLMKDIFRRAYNFLLAIPAFITPAFVARRADPERWGIDDFIFNFVIPSLKKEDLLLDAGAGSGRYREALVGACQYQSTDFEDVFDKATKSRHDFICSLDDIPQPDNTYDVVVNTQVLEHVEYPQKVISELQRILKPGGRLFLTTPQMSPMHGVPYNFFFFTEFGLRSLFKNAGFAVEFVRPRGGIFWVLGKMFSQLPLYLFYQHVYGGFKKDIHFKPRIKSWLLALLLLPIYLVFQIFLGIVLPFIFFFIDPLDRQRYFTLGYVCYCKKPTSGE